MTLLHTYVGTDAARREAQREAICRRCVLLLRERAGGR